MSRRRPGSELGQASVELALVLPVLFTLVLALVQVAVVVRDAVLVTHAAREAVRQAAVGDGNDDERKAAATYAAVKSSGLDRNRLTISVHSDRAPSDTVEVRLQYRVPTEVALVGRLIGEVKLERRAVMRRETRSTT